MRTRLALVALSASALLLAAPIARAQDTGSAAWDGSSISVPPTTEVGVVNVAVYFTRNGAREIQIAFRSTGAPPSGCAMPADVYSAPARTPTSFAADLTFGCNGTYTVTADAATTDDSAVFPHDYASRSRTVAVSMPAQAVTGVSAAAEGSTIRVLWDDMRVAAWDLSGYVIERQVDDGSFTELAVLGSESTSYVDESLPGEGRAATYRVSSTRPAPAGTQVSAASSSEATPFEATATTTTTPGDGTTGDGTTGDGTTPGTGTTPGGGTTAGGTTIPSTPGTGSVATRPGGTVRAPRLGISGSFLPPLLRPSGSFGVPTTVDGGFSEQLPYGQDTEPGEDDPVLPDDEMASLFTDGAAGRGMAIPIATALVLAVWAFHLRFLARASRPTG
jgi:hypothetical protein